MNLISEENTQLPDTLVSIDAVTLSRGKFTLKDITLELHRGETVLLLGHNGAGKTTFLRMLARLISPEKGRITRPHHSVAFVSHELMGYGGLTVRKNLEFFCALEGRSLPEDAIRDWELSDHLEKPASQLSRGLASRLSLLRALTSDSQLLLFDEPTSALDDKSAFMFTQAVQKKTSEGKAVCIATHDLTRTLSIASRVLVLAGGILQFDSRGPEEINAALNVYHTLNR